MASPATTSHAGPADQRTALTFSAALRAREDTALVALLRARPDLASPSPSTLRSLAARATGRAATDHALALLSTLETQVLEAVVVLGAAPGDPAPHRLAAADVVAALAPADGIDPPALVAAATAALDRLRERALVWDAGVRPARSRGKVPSDLRPAPGVAELLGPYPAGLAPRDEPSTPGSRSATAPALPDDAPPAARAVLDALAWGPPVGLVPSDPRGVAGVDWLADRGLVLRSGADQVLLPRAVALALRGGRTHRDVHPAAPLPTAPGAAAPGAAGQGPSVGATGRTTSTPHPETVDAEAARAALESVRLVTELVDFWESDPPLVLRTGGLAHRDLRRLALRLDVDEPTAAWVAEVAHAAGLVVDDGDVPATFAPTTDVDVWTAGDVAEQWTTLATSWLASARTAWLATTRDERGGLLAALDPTLTAPWTSRLRRSVLEVLAEHPDASFTADDVRRALAWASPRSVPPADAVAGTLTAAERLGVVALGTLTGPGRALLVGDPTEALSAVLPAEVDDLLLQGDLTGIVPGRPSRAVARLVDAAADVESRGSALSVRFTPASVTRALAAGASAEELLTDLASHARGGVPQPLEYLVHDAARRFARVRVGAAQSYVRVDDPALARALLDRLRPLGARLLAPTVIAADVPAAQLHAALAEAGHTAALEGPDGRTVVAGRERARVTTARRGWRGARGGGSVVGRSGPGGPADGDRLLRVVAELRARDDLADAPAPRPDSTRRPLAGPASSPGTSGTSGTSAGAPQGAPGARVRTTTAPRSSARPGTTAPGDLLALLQEAIAEHALVDLRTVDSRGVPITRTVRPLRLDAGRLRAVDPVRDAELTVAVHRIAGVVPVAPPTSPRPVTAPAAPTAPTAPTTGPTTHPEGTA